MEKPTEDRRRLSQAGLLESAIRTLGQLTASRDPSTRNVANRVLSDLQQLRRQFPKRRQQDGA